MGICKKYIILANGNSKSFEVPRQLIEINGETIINRTIRLLKENGITDIIISSSNKMFDNLGVKRYNPINNDFDYNKKTGYWLNAFPFEIINEPICFIWGDVYFSDNAIKTIVKEDTDSTLFFCSHNNTDKKYIKKHDEPFAYKIVDIELFKNHINIVKRMYDERKTVRHPIIWEVYRSMNGLDINKHIMADNYIAINDITCDIDSKEDIDKIKIKLGGECMVKCKVLNEFSLSNFDKLKNIKRATDKNMEGNLFKDDTFECEDDMAEYLLGNNKYGKPFIKVIEVVPTKKVEPVEKVVINKTKKTKLTTKK